MVRHVGALAPLAIGAVLLAPATARPCVTVIEAPFTGSTVPEDEAVGVPRNLHLFIEGPADDETAVLVDDGSETRAAEIVEREGVIVIDLGLLAATRRYVVRFERDAEGFALPEPRSFTTGEAEDRSPPLLVEQPVIEQRYAPPTVPGFEDSCGPHGEIYATLVYFPAVEDESGVAAYRLLRVAPDGSTTVVSATVRPSLSALIAHENAPGGYRYVLEVLDLAGNATRSETIEVFHQALGGCSASAPSTSLALLPLLGALAVRRRRRTTPVRAAARGYHSARAPRTGWARCACRGREGLSRL